MRIFLDANVLFSVAHRTDSPLHAFFHLAEARMCELLASRFAQLRGVEVLPPRTALERILAA